MDYEKLYNEQRERAEKAEAKVKQLETAAKAAADRAKATSEDLTLHSALISAGATKKSAKHAILALRGETKTLDFDDEGGLVFAQFDGRVFRSADELAAAFIDRFPNFTQAHEDAVMRQNGMPGAPANFDNMSPESLATLYLERWSGREGEGASSGSEFRDKGHGILDPMTKYLEARERR